MSGSTTSDYRVGVLGPLTVSANGADSDLGGPKQRLLLALLLADIDHVVTTDRLIEGLWGEDPPATARKAVQVHVSNLRRVLGDGFPLRTAPGGYLVQSVDLEVDALSFERELDAAKATLRTDPLGAERTLTDAIGRWTGTAYADLDNEPALEAEIARLIELRLQALEVRLDAELRVGHHADVVGELATLSAEYPYRERFTELHMLALYRSGRQTEALRAYQRTRSTLVEELGVDPGPSLQALQQQVLEQSAELDLADAGGDDRYAFLATDIEASTAMWEADADAMQRAVARHDEILADAVTANAGTVFKGTGDGIFAVFAAAADALQAAVDGQQALDAEPWPTVRPIRVRMGVDEGPASARGGDYFGPALNRVSRVMSSGYGGQVLCPAELASQASVPTRNLGDADYKGIGRLDVTQLDVPGLPDEFPDLQTDRTPKTMVREGFGRAIRGYELRERLGEGAHGVVYRAYQAAIGREVAIKVIRPEHANRAEFVKRFEAEAQFVAQLEHPHIVSLYDYWRDPDGAYLVMQLLRGGSLATSLERAPWRPPAALQLLEQVGSALDYAHRQGIMHRDLKPANVVLDAEGNAYLSDFGIASQHVEAVGVPVGSSVAYVSPEELAGDAVGLAADMYGMALLTYEILTGERPVPGGQPAPITDRRQDLPPALDQVLARAADPDPAKRFDRVDDFLRALRQVFGADVVTHQRRSAPTETRNPYKGLRAFAETDTHDFFGHDEVVRELVDHVTTHRLTAVVGPSGSGKSSLVHAGLLPQIRRGAGTGQGAVLVTDMFPGSYPFEELEAALLRVAVDRREDLLAELVADDRGLLRMSKQLLPDDDSELLLVIDQFEELFLLTHDDAARRQFLASLVTVASDERSRVRVVVTMRADHFDRPLADPEFGALLRNNVVPISMPTHDELTRAIAQPAAGAGLEFETGLIPRIVRDVADEPGALPLLQYALTELVRARDHAELTVAGYERTGGVAGALTLRAEEIYQGLSPSASDAAREVFLRLVAVDDSGDDTRRRVRRAELDSLGLGESALDAVIDSYGAFRLLSFDRDPVTRGPTVEVAHEALIREWPRYRGWVDERREDLLLERRLEAASTEWDGSEREPSFLFRGGQLDQYEQWAHETDVRLTEIERAFLEESRTAGDEATATRKRRRRGVLSAVAVFATLALIAAVVAVLQRNDANDSASRAEEAQRASDEARTEAEASADAERTARETAEQAQRDAVSAAELERAARADAEIRQMVLQSTNLAEDKPSVSLLLAREAYDREPGPETLGALLAGLQRADGYLGAMPLTTTSNNDQWLGLLDDATVVVRTTGSIDVYDLEERELLTSTPSTAAQPKGSAVGSSAAGRFATVDATGNVLVIERGSTEPITWLAASGTKVATNVAVGLDGSTLVGYEDGDVEFFRGPSATDPVELIGHHRPVTFLAVNNDSTLVATQDELANLTIWDVDTAVALWTVTYGDPDRWRADIPPEGRDGFFLGVVDGGPPVEQEDVRVGGQLFGGELSFSADGQSIYWLFFGLRSLNIDIREPGWTVDLPESILQFQETAPGRLIAGNQTIVDRSLGDPLEAIAPNARTVVTSDNSTLVALDIENISMWSLTGDQMIAKGFDHDGAVVPSLSRDGRQLAAFGFASTGLSAWGRVWDTVSKTMTPVLPDGGHWIYFDSSDALVSFHSPPPRRAEIIDAGTLEPTTPSVPLGSWASIETSPDGALVAIGRLGEATIDLHDATTMEAVATLSTPLPDDSIHPPFWIDFAPDGQLIAASTGSAVAVWETGEWTALDTVTAPDGETLTAIAFSPDGSQLAIRSNDGELLLHDLSSGATRTIASGTVAGGGIYSVNTLEFSEDGRYVAIAGSNGGVSLVDIESGQILGIDAPTPNRILDWGAAVANGGRATVSATDEHLIVWNLAPEDWPDIACRAAGRNLTLDEWDQFGWPDEPYNATCPEWGAAS